MFSIKLSCYIKVSTTFCFVFRYHQSLIMPCMSCSSWTFEKDSSLNKGTNEYSAGYFCGEMSPMCCVLVLLEAALCIYRDSCFKICDHLSRHNHRCYKPPPSALSLGFWENMRCGLLRPSQHVLHQRVPSGGAKQRSYLSSVDDASSLLLHRWLCTRRQKGMSMTCLCTLCSTSSCS